MAIKDQCGKCQFFSGDQCSNSAAKYEFDQRSCEYYIKSSVNLGKIEDLPDGGSSQSSHSSSINLDKKEEVVSVGQERPIPTPTITEDRGNTHSVTSRPQVQGMFSHPFSFNGRIRRTEYALSILIYWFWYLILYILVEGNAVTGGLFALVTFIPAVWFLLAQHCKRFHDQGHSGWFFLLFFIPIVNFGVGIMQLFFDGDAYENEYGPDPKGRHF